MEPLFPTQRLIGSVFGLMCLLWVLLRVGYQRVAGRTWAAGYGGWERAGL